MKISNRWLGMYCIGGITFGAVMVGFNIGLNHTISYGGIFCTLVCASNLGGIVWRAE